MPFRSRRTLTEVEGNLLLDGCLNQSAFPEFSSAFIISSFYEVLSDT